MRNGQKTLNKLKDDIMWIFILVLCLCIAACVISYRSAELHELHKMRAGFENMRKHLETSIRNNHIEHLGSQFPIDEIATDEEKGELEEINEVINTVEDEIKEFVNGRLI